MYPIYTSPQYTSSQNQFPQLEYHRYYDSPQVLLAKLWDEYYFHLYTRALPDLLVSPLGNHPEPSSGSWSEGFTLRGELRWGKLERVFGGSQELPDFLKADLRRVYGTYPSTSVNVTYQRGEFVVRGQPRVGEQEYQVEKRLVQQIEGCRNEDKAEQKFKKPKKGK